MEDVIFGYQVFEKGEYAIDLLGSKSKEEELILFGVYESDLSPIARGRVDFFPYGGVPEDNDGDFNRISFTSDFFLFIDSTVELFREFAKVGGYMTKEQTIEALQKCGFIDVTTQAEL